MSHHARKIFGFSLHLSRTILHDGYPDVQRVIKMFAHNDENHIYELCNIKVSRQYWNPSLIKIKILADRLGMASG